MGRLSTVCGMSKQNAAPRQNGQSDDQWTRCVGTLLRGNAARYMVAVMVPSMRGGDKCGDDDMMSDMGMMSSNMHEDVVRWLRRTARTAGMTVREVDGHQVDLSTVISTVERAAGTHDLLRLVYNTPGVFMLYNADAHLKRSSILRELIVKKTARRRWGGGSTTFVLVVTSPSVIATTLTKDAMGERSRWALFEWNGRNGIVPRARRDTAATSTRPMSKYTTHPHPSTACRGWGGDSVISDALAAIWREDGDDERVAAIIRATGVDPPILPEYIAHNMWSLGMRRYPVCRALEVYKLAMDLRTWGARLPSLTDIVTITRLAVRCGWGEVPRPLSARRGGSCPEGGDSSTTTKLRFPRYLCYTTRQKSMSKFLDVCSAHLGWDEAGTVYFLGQVGPALCPASLPTGMSKHARRIATTASSAARAMVDGSSSSQVDHSLFLAI